MTIIKLFALMIAVICIIGVLTLTYKLEKETDPEKRGEYILGLFLAIFIGSSCIASILVL
jgi:prolipoprotein diacylglyceryltransferase